jgi:hypothetical protein
MPSRVRIRVTSTWRVSARCQRLDDEHLNGESVAEVAPCDVPAQLSCCPACRLAWREPGEPCGSLRTGERAPQPRPSNRPSGRRRRRPRPRHARSERRGASAPAVEPLRNPSVTPTVSCHHAGETKWYRGILGTVPDHGRGPSGRNREHRDIDSLVACRRHPVRVRTPVVGLSHVQSRRDEDIQAE